MYLDTILDCLRCLAGTLTPETTHYVVETMARATMGVANLGLPVSSGWAPCVLVGRKGQRRMGGGGW
jgi:hypothetical protein